MWAGLPFGTFATLIRAVLLCLRPLHGITYHINLSPTPLTSSFLCDRNKFFTLTRGPNLEKGGAPSTHKWIRSPSCSVGASQVYLHDLCLFNTPDSLCLLLPTSLHTLVTPYIHHHLCYPVHFSVLTFISPNITLYVGHSLNTSLLMLLLTIITPYVMLYNCQSLHKSLLTFLPHFLTLYVRDSLFVTSYIILCVSHSLLSSIAMLLHTFISLYVCHSLHSPPPE